MTLQEMKTNLESLHATFAENGGRGVELAEEIDQIQAKVDVLEGRKEVHDAKESSEV